MIYRHLHVENFGIHRNWQTPLAENVQLLYGPNETGKTTLLQLLRELLFRIHPRTPYLSCSGHGPIAARVEFELSDGRRGWFRRQKGTQDQIIGELTGGPPLDRQGRLDALIGGVGSSLYANVFAFSADELRAGADSLQEADLAEALFGGGIGGLGRFRQVEAHLQQRMEELFKPGGSRPRINAQLTEIRAAAEQFQQAQCRPQTYDEWEEQRQAHAVNITRLDQQMEELRRRREVLRRQKQALQVWSRRTDALDKRRRIEVPAGMTRELAAEVHELTKAQRPLRDNLQALEEQRLRRRPVAPLTPAEAALLAAEEEIHTLQPHLSQMAELRDELPRLRSEHCRLAKELERFRRERPGRDRCLVTQAQKEATRLLAEKLPSLEERARSLKQQREKIDGRLKKRRVELESLPPSRSVEQWEFLAKGAAVWQARVHTQRDKAARLAEVQRDIDGLLRDLGSVVGREFHLTQPLPLPLKTTIEAFRDRWERQDRETAEAQQRLEAARDDFHRARQALAECEGLGPGHEADHVAESRAHRDRGWNLVQRRYCTTGSSPVDAGLTAEIEAWTEHRPDQLLELYEAAVSAADQAADQALERAAWESRRQQLRREVELRAGRCAQLESALAALRQRAVDLHAEWDQLWSPAGIRPRSPREMLEWLQKRQALEAQHTQAARLQQELDAIEQDCKAFAQQFARVLPELPLAPSEAVVQAVEKVAREVRQTEENRSRLLEDVNQLMTEDEELQPQERQVQEELAAWTGRLAALLEELKLPAEWRLQQLQEEIEQLQKAAEKQEQLEDVERRLREAENRWSAFEQEVQRVWELVAGGTSRLEAVAAAEELSRRLKDARQRREEIDRAAADAAADERIRADTAKKLEQCDTRLAALWQQLGFSSLAALESGVERFEQADKLDEEIRQCERDLGHILGAAWESHAEELSAANEAELTAKLDHLDIELDQLNKSHKAEAAAEGTIAHRLQTLAEETEAVARAAELEARRAELTAAVQEWAPLALTQVLLQRAIKRFQEERQPELLREVAALMQQITNGEHVAIRRSLGSENDEPQLLVEDRHGRLRTADQLSLGAREQLYLAIRLAFVADYCRRNEPLPVVMDDVLVHFDDDRARRTLEVLAEFSEHAQVLLLTCHRRTVELWREVRPQAPILDLTRTEGDHTTMAAQRPVGRRKRSTRAEASRLFPPPEQ